MVYEYVVEQLRMYALETPVSEGEYNHVHDKQAMDVKGSRVLENDIIPMTLGEKMETDRDRQPPDTDSHCQGEYAGCDPIEKDRPFALC